MQTLLKLMQLNAGKTSDSGILNNVVFSRESDLVTKIHSNRFSERDTLISRPTWTMGRRIANMKMQPQMPSQPTTVRGATPKS